MGPGPGRAEHGMVPELFTIMFVENGVQSWHAKSPLRGHIHVQEYLGAYMLVVKQVTERAIELAHHKTDI